MLKTCGKSEEALEENLNTVLESIIKISCVIVVIILKYILGCCHNMICLHLNLYYAHAGADVNFSWTVCLHVLRVAEFGFPEKISFDFNLAARFNVIPLPVISFEADALGEQE